MNKHKYYVENHFYVPLACLLIVGILSMKTSKFVSIGSRNLYSATTCTILLTGGESPS